jgi:hypothetical protein
MFKFIMNMEKQHCAKSRGAFKYWYLFSFKYWYFFFRQKSVLLEVSCQNAHCKSTCQSMDLVTFDDYSNRKHPETSRSNARFAVLYFLWEIKFVIKNFFISKEHRSMVLIFEFNIFTFFGVRNAGFFHCELTYYLCVML